MKEGTPILEYLNSLNKIIINLPSIEVKLDEDDKAFILFNSLSSFYEHLVTTILYGKEALVMENVTATLLSDEIRRKSHHKEENEGLVARNKDREKFTC